MKIRVAFGTGALLGLWHGKVEVPPTTAHFLTYYEGRCQANCKFCPQASGSTSDLQMLSRVVWPAHDFERVINALKQNSEKFERICVQSVNYPAVVEDLCFLVKELKKISDLPISVSSRPLTKTEMLEIEHAGADRFCFPLDACTSEIFTRVKEGYRWKEHLEALEQASSMFHDRVTTHLIIGLGETEEQATRMIQWLHDRRITVGLFAFTPIIGTPLEERPRPNLASYRRIQLAHYLIREGLARAENMEFVNGKLERWGIELDKLNKIVASGKPFRTSGCPGCNRPFYNESPRGPMYNFPRKLTKREIEEIKRMLALP